MPPEGLGGTSSAASVGSQMSESKGSGSGSGSGNAGRGFDIQEESERGGSSGFLGEENVGESARSGEFGNTEPSGGSAGRSGSGAEPFLGDSSGSSSGSSLGSSSGSSSGSRSGIDEARRQSFKSSNSLKDIYFKFDQYDLDDESRSTLRQNASYLKSNSAAIIEIQGHCDERGTNNYNIALGERRAQSTKMYLVSQGISSKRIHTISYGEERPFCFDGNDACWFQNRRAHFRISE